REREHAPGGVRAHGPRAGVPLQGEVAFGAQDADAGDGGGRRPGWDQQRTLGGGKAVDGDLGGGWSGQGQRTGEEQGPPQERLGTTHAPWDGAAFVSHLLSVRQSGTLIGRPTRRLA